MSKLAINMHTSQVAHGVIPAADYEAADLNIVRVGYTISMIHLHLYESDDPVAQVFWYSHEPGVVLIYEDGQSPVEEPNDILEVGEKDFTIDGAAVDATLFGTADAVRWQVDGCHNADSVGLNPDNPNPGPVNADGAMDPIPQWYPGLYEPHEGEAEGEGESEAT